MQAFSDWLEPRLQPSHRWVDLNDSQPTIAQSLERAESFLLLGGSLGIMLAAFA